MENPIPQGSSFYYSAAWVIIRIFHMIFHQDCRITGGQDIPTGAKIIAGNHPDATDGLFLPFVFKEMLHFFIQGDIFSIPFIGWLLTKSGQIAVMPDFKLAAFRQAISLLKQGQTVVIFPEAQLNPNGETLKSATGAVRLSLCTGIPIIPIGFYVPPINLRYLQRKGKDRISRGHWQTQGHCYLHIGSPWLPGDDNAVSSSLASAHILTERLMQIIREQAQLAMQAFAIESGQPVELASFSDH